MSHPGRALVPWAHESSVDAVSRHVDVRGPFFVVQPQRAARRHRPHVVALARVEGSVVMILEQ